MRPSQEALKCLAAVVAGQLPPNAIPDHLWPAAVTQAVQHGLAPLLLHCIRQAGAEPPGVNLSPLKQAARQNTAHYAVLELAQAQVEALLREAGIPTVWLKGIALAQTLYPDPTLRPMGDLDVLVPYPQREVALKTIQSQGYRFRNTPDMLIGADDKLVQKWAYHYHLVGGPAQAVTLELHSRLVSTDDRVLPLEDMGWFWEQTQPCRTLSAEFRTLTPASHLLYLCAHAELQHGNLYLLRYLDLHLLLTHTPLDWSLVIRQAAALRWTYAVESALLICAEWFGTTLPTGMIEQLRAQRPADEDATRTRELKERGSRWARVHRLLARLSPTDQLRLITRAVFPPPVYMRHRYAVAAGRPVWPYYLYRWLDQAREVLYYVGKRKNGHQRPLEK